MFNPNDVIGLQGVLAAHGRCKMLREIRNRSARIVWQLRCDEDILPIASPMHLNVAARIAVPESLIVVAHRYAASPLRPTNVPQSRCSLPSTKTTGNRSPEGVTSKVVF